MNITEKIKNIGRKAAIFSMLALGSGCYSIDEPVSKKDFLMSRKVEQYCDRIFYIYAELYPPLSIAEKKELLGKIDANKDGVISNVEALVMLNELNKELEKALRY